MIGPAIAGALIAWLGAPAVLVIDAGTFLFAFACVALLVEGGRRVAPDGDARGLLAGIRYLGRDRLLGPMTLAVIILDGAAGAIAVAVPLVAYTRYDGNVHVAGWLFTSFGVGAVIGSLAAAKLLDRIQPLHLASAAMACATLPLWAIAADISWPAACAAVAICGFFVPMVNAPMMGILSTRPPLALRAKVMTAVMTASGLGGPARPGSPSAPSITPSGTRGSGSWSRAASASAPSSGSRPRCGGRPRTSPGSRSAKANLPRVLEENGSSSPAAPASSARRWRAS